MSEFRCGHPRTPENSRPKRDGHGRVHLLCRTCNNAAARAAQAARRAKHRPTAASGPSKAQPTMQERAVTFPVEPLLDYARMRPLDTRTERAVERAQIAGRLNILAADKLACAIGLHPGLIWPEWWEVGAA